MSPDTELRARAASPASAARAYLREQLEREYATYFGLPPAQFFERT